MLWVISNLLCDHVGLLQVVVVAVHLVNFLGWSHILRHSYLWHFFVRALLHG